jgi:hypothetical protein
MSETLVEVEIMRDFFTGAARPSIFSIVGGEGIDQTRLCKGDTVSRLSQGEVNEARAQVQPTATELAQQELERFQRLNAPRPKNVPPMDSRPHWMGKLVGPMSPQHGPASNSKR